MITSDLTSTARERARTTEPEAAPVGLLSPCSLPGHTPLRSAQYGDRASPPIVTLADALQHIQVWKKSIPAKSAGEAAAALRLLERETGQKANELPASPKDLTPILEATFSTRRRAKRKRWQNMVSSIRTLLRACGLHAPLADDPRPADPAWTAIIGSLPTKQERGSLLGLARWCSDLGIQPGDFTERTLDDYIEFRRTQTIRAGLPGLRSEIHMFWNRSVRRNLPGFPSRLLAAPGSPLVEALPECSFPISFQSHLAEYLSSRTTPDAFDGNGRKWRPATASAARRIILRAAAWRPSDAAARSIFSLWPMSSPSQRSSSP
jgi:hypothetical protein